MISCKHIKDDIKSINNIKSNYELRDAILHHIISASHQNAAACHRWFRSLEVLSNIINQWCRGDLKAMRIGSIRKQRIILSRLQRQDFRQRDFLQRGWSKGVWVEYSLQYQHQYTIHDVPPESVVEGCAVLQVIYIHGSGWRDAFYLSCKPIRLSLCYFMSFKIIKTLRH